MEALMQYVWQHRLLTGADMATVDGQRVRVLDPGTLNRGPGPDFSNAKLYIGSQHWAGDVEIHVRASDWHRHGHDGDPAYGSVVLHVVDSSDTLIRRADGETIQQMVMQCDPAFSRTYQDLVGRADLDLPCAAQLARLPEVVVTDWLTALGFERVYQKAQRVVQAVEAAGGDWEQACYATLARGLGFGTNAEPFQRLAAAMPLWVLRKHSDQPRALEAMLLGQSGLLDDAPLDDDYAVALRSDYQFYRRKFSLSPLQSPGWRAGRPQNSPHRRIALLAAFVSGGFGLMGRMLECGDAEAARRLFRVQPSAYWDRHYNFASPSARALGGLGEAARTLLVVNVTVPVMMAHSMERGDDAAGDRAVGLLSQLPAERNQIVAAFARAGVPVGDAFVSQAVIQLRRAYCEPRKCLYCRFGHRLLAARALRVQPPALRAV